VFSSGSVSQYVERTGLGGVVMPLICGKPPAAVPLLPTTTTTLPGGGGIVNVDDWSAGGAIGVGLGIMFLTNPRWMLTVASAAFSASSGEIWFGTFSSSAPLPQPPPPLTTLKSDALRFSDPDDEARVIPPSSFLSCARAFPSDSKSGRRDNFFILAEGTSDPTFGSFANTFCRR